MSKVVIGKLIFMIVMRFNRRMMSRGDKRRTFVGMFLPSGRMRVSGGYIAGMFTMLLHETGYSLMIMMRKDPDSQKDG
ncbi:MAG TPA: hypothetical protein DEF88_08275 [Porphyromonadaceae bacterium]|nr:hypothetical protein [Porphyromonadaceae bacterium]